MDKEQDTGAWTREAPTEPGRYWVIRRYSVEPEQAKFRYTVGGRWIQIAIPSRGSYGLSEFVLFGPPVTPPPGWESALAAMREEVDE